MELRLYWEVLTSIFIIDKEMVSCFPSTPKKLAMNVGCFIAGAALFAVGVHISYVNIGPQQARIKARNDFVKERLRKKYGKP
ncbi:Bric-a-brac protein [Melia azedarach]|uniref:Bric-a-brac protein n=1 Tax=Melia azedarach TaxID=155640 RepID=A0ACC1YP45_MELAZ|nr:Bric-a-brac protein [Melia azedarach]